MPHTTSNKLGIVLVHACLFCLIAVAAPSRLTAPAPVSEPTDLEAVTILEELAEWVGEASEQATADERSLAESIRLRPSSFDLFRLYHDASDRRSQLLQVPYGEAIAQTADRHDIDGFLLAAIVETESSFDNTAQSHRGAVGLMQLMPSTAGVESEALIDPTLNLDLGARYLRRLLYRFDGDLELALAAYNAGPTAVRRYDGLPPYPETRRYVEKVLDLYVGYHRSRWHEIASDELVALL